MCASVVPDESHPPNPNREPEDEQAHPNDLAEKFYIGLKEFVSSCRQPMTVFTGLLVLFTAVLALFAFLQWRTLEKTEQTSRLRDRAFIYLEPTFVLYPPDKPTSFAIGVNVWNAGNTPPRGLSIVHTCRKSENAPVDPFTLGGWYKADLPRIGPKQIFKLQMQECGFPLNLRELIIKQTIYISSGMAVQYTDGLDLETTRFTETSIILNLDTAGGQSFTFTKSHNCSDEECKKQYDKSPAGVPTAPTSATPTSATPSLFPK